MVSIRTPKGLENYNPWGKTLADLQKEHPDLKISKIGIRPTDGVKFRAGQWVKLNNGDEIKIIGFDNYNYPIPIDESDKPIAQIINGGLQTSVYKSKHRKIVRAIHAICGRFCFTDLEEYEWKTTTDQ